MRSFDEIWQIAASRKGGPDVLESELSKPLAASALAAIPDSKVLETFSAGIMTTGLAVNVIKNKWSGIFDAFHGFDIGWCIMIDGERFETLMKDQRIIRHAAKVLSVRDNAIWISKLREEHGSAAKFLQSWPSERFDELLEELKSSGSRLGGKVGAYCLRRLGFDSYILTRDVTARLIAEGIISKSATSKADLRKVQEAFTIWQHQSGRSFTEISQVLARSIGD